MYDRVFLIDKFYWNYEDKRKTVESFSDNNWFGPSSATNDGAEIGSYDHWSQNEMGIESKSFPKIIKVLRTKIHEFLGPLSFPNM